MATPRNTTEMLAAAIKSLVDKSAKSGGEKENLQLRDYASTAVKALNIQCDVYAVAGHCYVADVPLDGRKKIVFRRLGQGLGVAA